MTDVKFKEQSETVYSRLEIFFKGTHQLSNTKKLFDRREDCAYSYAERLAGWSGEWDPVSITNSDWDSIYQVYAADTEDIKKGEIIEIYCLRPATEGFGQPGEGFDEEIVGPFFYKIEVDDIRLNKKEQISEDRICLSKVN